jgi:hypothetical protein
MNCNHICNSIGTTIWNREDDAHFLASNFVIGDNFLVLEKIKF